MKKLFIVLAAVVITSSAAFAQRPVAGAAGFTFGINGLAAFGLAGTSNVTTVNPNLDPTVLFRYYLADDMAVRVGLNYQRTRSVVNSEPAVGQSTEVITRNSDFGIALGIQKSLGDGEKLEPFVGLDLMVGRSGGKTVNRSEFDGTGANAAGDFTETETKNTPVMYLGLAPVVGFNYYFVENFAVGAEFAYAIVRQGEGESETKVTNSFGGTTTTTTTNGLKGSAASFGPLSGANANITVTVLF